VAEEYKGAKHGIFRKTRVHEESGNESERKKRCSDSIRKKRKPIDLRHLHDFVLDPKGKRMSEAATGWQHLGDMVRATICVQSIAELWDAYTWFKKSGVFEILKVKDKLTSDLKNITINFDFDNKIIGELQFRYEPIPP